LQLRRSPWSAWCSLSALRGLGRGVYRLGRDCLGGGNPHEDNLIKTFVAPVLQVFHSTQAPSRGTGHRPAGGGYRFLAIKHEGEATAAFLTHLGFDVVMLEYHVLNSPETAGLPDNERLAKARALDDSVKAYRLVREQGKNLGLRTDRLTLLGYSAGGHLAARTAEALTAAEQPDLLVLVYPAYLDKTKPGSKEPEVLPPAQSKRLVVLMGDKDNANWIQGSQNYAHAWSADPRRVNYVLIPGAGHGFGASRLDAIAMLLTEPPR